MGLEDIKLIINGVERQIWSYSREWPRGWQEDDKPHMLTIHAWIVPSDKQIPPTPSDQIVPLLDKILKDNE